MRSPIDPCIGLRIGERVEERGERREKRKANVIRGRGERRERKGGPNMIRGDRGGIEGLTVVFQWGPQGLKRSPID